MRVLFTGGGTAGHVYPQIAISDILKTRFKDVKCAFVGRKEGLEAEIFKKRKEKFFYIDVSGFRRSLSLKNIGVVFKTLKGIKRSREIIRNFKPDLIIGTGGYVSYPLIKAGQQMGIKTILHESNAYPGMTTKLLSKKCCTVLLNYEKAKMHLSKRAKTLTVGNPIRKEFEKYTKDEARRRLGIKKDEIFILSFGGSIGAELINETSLSLMKNFSAKDKKIKHLHATGKRFYAEYERKYKEYCMGKDGCKILSYIDETPLYLSAADITVTRSGAVTLSELAYCKTSAILIPSPNVTANHQYENAKYLSDAGAAILIEEKNLTQNTLLNSVSSLVSDPYKRKKMSEGITKFYNVECKEKIAEAINALYNSAEC